MPLPDSKGEPFILLCNHSFMTMITEHSLCARHGARPLRYRHNAGPCLPPGRLSASILFYFFKVKLLSPYS